MSRILRWLCVLPLSSLVLSTPRLRAEVVLDQVISRESPLFQCKTSRLTVGRDGLVYLVSESHGKGFCLRISRYGTQKLGGEVVYAIHNGTANKDGVIATANAHFNHSLNLYDANFNKLHAQDDFLVNDQVGWNAPLHVEAGSQSGEFYGLDQHRNRIVRVGVDGKLKAVYTVRPDFVDDWGKPRTFRVSEPLQSFFFLTGSELVRTKFDGSLVWKVKLPVHDSSDGNSSGAFDVDDAGSTYYIEGTGLTLKRLNADGQSFGDLKSPISDLKLEWGELKPIAGEHIVGLRVFGNDIVLRRSSLTELFQVFDLTTGKRKHVESIAHERLTVTFPSLVWTNGEKLPLKVTFLECGDSSPLSNIAERSSFRSQLPAEKNKDGSAEVKSGDQSRRSTSAERSSSSSTAATKKNKDGSAEDQSGDESPHSKSPRFRVWMTPFGISDWQELSRDAESNIVVPADYAGLYQLKVSPEVTPRQTAEPSEYLVREIIEVRKPNSQGTIAVVTPLNRSYYRVEEGIVGRVIQRAIAPHAVTKVAVELREVATGKVTQTRDVTLTTSATDPALATGDFHFDGLINGSSEKSFRLVVNVPHLTCVDQRLQSGPTIANFVHAIASFCITLYGDYGITFPQRNAWESADAAISHGERMQKLGFNQFVNRANWQLSLDFANTDDGRGLLNRVKERLQKDPLAVTPEKAEFGSAHHQIAEVYSANNWRELFLLVNMDGGLPIGTGFDTRKPEQFAESIKRYTEAFWSYPAFGGWTWVANWWLFDANAKFKTPDEKPKYEAALKVARETGKWDPILDQVDDRKFQFAVDAQESFNKTLREVEESRLSLRERAPQSKEAGSNNGDSKTLFRGAKGDNEETRRRFVTASAGPYRRPEVLNEINFSNVDEIDVQYQAEQLTTPDWLHHAVDNAKRFRQPAWTHPELWNDFGTGEQILPMSWLAVMRGAGGIGTAGNVPNWPNVPMDSRGGYHGTTSVFRATNWLFESAEVVALTALLRLSAEQLGDDDRVGIVVSPRQVKIETFGSGVGSPTFSRQFEAYQSFLYANCAARFVTLEEIKLKAGRTELPVKYGAYELLPLKRRFDALLLVGQTVELEPEWQLFLQQAKAAGIRVLADGTSRREVCLDAEELGLKFDFVEKEHSANNDHAFYTYPARFLANAEALAPTVQQLKANSKRRKDIVSIVDVQGAERPVVLVREWFNSARDPKEPASGFVIVVNNTPTSLEPGQLRRVGRAISTRTPVIAQLKFDIPDDFRIFDVMANKLVDSECVADLRDAYGRIYFVSPKDVVERLLANRARDENAATRPAPMKSSHAEQQLFGPHLRDVAVATDGKTAMLNAFNWDDNLYYIDLETGRELPPHRVLAQGRIGDHFAYAPKATKAGFFVQGFDLKTAEGYQLYSLTRSQAPLGNGPTEALLPESNGKQSSSLQNRSGSGASKAAFPSRAWERVDVERVSLDRRFALPALPGCLTGWAFTAWIQDRVNNFAVPTSGDWIAGSGNLGIAIWDRDGKLLWSEDWSREKRQSCLVEALGEETLLIANGMTITARTQTSTRSQALLGNARPEAPLPEPPSGTKPTEQKAGTGSRDSDAAFPSGAWERVDWAHKLANSGEIIGLHPASDGKTVAIRTTAGGGTVFVIREGQLIGKLLTTADDLSLSGDGSLIAVTTGHQLRVFQMGPMGQGPMGRMQPMREEKTVAIQKDASEVGADAGAKASGPISPTPINPIAAIPLSWLAHGDDQLRFPRVSSDDRRIAVSSELGTVYVFDRDGAKEHQRDEFSICVPAWLPNDDLLLASWMGTVVRVDVEYKDLWRTHVRDGEKAENRTGSRASRTAFPSGASERVPTSRVTSWIAAESKLTDKKNLLAPNQFIARFMLGDFAATPQRNVNELVDGKFLECGDSSPLSNIAERSSSFSSSSPATPKKNKDGSAENQSGDESPHSKSWLDWRDHGMIESGWRGEFALVVDSFNKQLRVDSLTFVEDCRHPESWLRDMKLEYWNADAEKWVFAEYLTSDSAVHHHTLKKPIEAARFRFVKADGHAWPAGNVRLQELMLHGEVLGASHPDVVAKRPIAVLFDENVASVKGSYEHGHNAGLKLATGAEAFSGGNYITLPGDKNYSALWQPPFGHMTPNWWFEVVEKPEPGQYRFLQFSVKALAPETKGITLRVAPAHYGGIAVHVGEPTKSDGAVLHQASEAVPFEWHTITVDLWELLPENQRGKPFNIGAMTIGTVGGPAAIDRIRLGRTREGLEGK